ncbi:MAG: hypothetical protein HQM04_02660 [Magnetococcales bacterium]|nr:hypothetical protein [Magnetococcales bacterium]MBF0113923.1 hypothetical protein [Magnetococcales bacterium]
MGKKITLLGRYSTPFRSALQRATVMGMDNSLTNRAKGRKISLLLGVNDSMARSVMVGTGVV